MNCILLTPEDFASPDTVCLHGRRLEHVRGVHRASVGDTLRVGVLGGRIGTGIVTALDEQQLVMEVSLTDEPPPATPCALVVALPRPKSMRKVLHVAATMGIKEMHFINSHRVDKSYWKSPRMEPEAVSDVLTLGLEQCVDTIMPRVSFHKRIRWFVEDDLPAIARDRCCLIAHPPATQVCPRALAGESVLAIGPEGGFVDYEVDYFVKAGFAPVSMGRRILRVEEAVAALLGRLY
jgi:16S rRNA (uracil1498-N3)-methyltransferase